MLKAQKRYAESKLNSDKEKHFTEHRKKMKEAQLAKEISRLDSEADVGVVKVKEHIASNDCDFYEAFRVLQVPLELRVIITQKIK